MKLSKNVFPKSSWYYPMKNVFWKDSDIFDIEKSEFCGFNNLDQKFSKKNYNALLVISGVLAPFSKVCNKFCWHGQKPYTG